MADATIALFEATERLERAQAGLDAATRWQRTATLDAPLAVKVADQRRVDAARAELGAAQAPYEAAQDIECPEGLRWRSSPRSPSAHATTADASSRTAA